MKPCQILEASTKPNVTKDGSGSLPPMTMFVGTIPGNSPGFSQFLLVNHISNLVQQISLCRGVSQRLRSYCMPNRDCRDF